MFSMTFGVSYSVAVASMFGAVVGVAEDTAVITAWVAHGEFTEVFTEGAVGEDGVVMVSEVTITEVVVVVATVVINGTVTEGAISEGNMTGVAQDLCPPFIGTSLRGRKTRINRKCWIKSKENKYKKVDKKSRK